MLLPHLIILLILFNIKWITSQYFIGDPARCPGSIYNNLNFEICTEGYGANGRPIETCIKQCPGLKGVGVEMVCLSSGLVVNCAHPASIDTELRIRCKRGYIPNPANTPFFRAKCQPNGRWSRQIYACIPECGLLKPGLTLNDTDDVTVPWEAFIYSGKPQDPVGHGSIIGPRAILTAANRVFRFYRPDVDFTDTSDFEIIVGKKNYNSRNLTEPHSQSRKVVKILASEIFEGYRITLTNDYAILVLDRDIEFYDDVMPVCLRNLKELPIPTEGYMILMGRKYLETGTLTSRRLDVFTRFKCLWFAEDGTERRFIPPDKFCAHTFNSIEDYFLGYPDVGQSLTHPEEGEEVGGRERHYLIGVLGNSMPQNTNHTMVNGTIPQLLAFVNLTVTSIERWLQNSQEEIFNSQYCKND